MTDSPQTIQYDYLVNGQKCLHYSYIALLFGTLSKTLTNAGQSPCIGVIIPSIQASLDLSLGKITGLYLIATSTSAVCLPFCGKVINKLGIRYFVTLVSLSLACSCFLISYVTSSLGLLLCFFCLRFFGQGNLFNISIIYINNWWCASRGTAMGIAGAAVSAFLLGLTPIIMMNLIEGIGWRGCYRVLGGTEVVGAAIAFIVWREGPEIYGVLPDGKWKEGGNKFKRKNSNLVAKQSATALSPPKLTNPTFLTYILSDLLMALTGTAFYFNLQQIFIDSPNIDDSIVTMIYPIMAGIGIVGRVLSGRLIDLFNHRVVFLSALIANALALFMIPSLNMVTVFIAAPLIGYGMSASGNVRGTVHAEYFGKGNLPRLQSVASSATVLGSALGPFPFGVCRDVTGSFDGAMFVSSAVSLVAAAAVWKCGGRPSVGGGGDGTYELVNFDGEGDEEEDDDDNDENDV
ncbi:hypothetical protein TL16_g04478 [Triparma laevis f. inornata]|uniref:Major facilitator superfamily (MFS) profile domain-containing protein n=1 Tax=Triparma laevis f. inornata TaxID=1714386 RepID=A0A9W7AAY8_9STRA|nr:hypothetical protein TL16_g04478 [Triparma laevis f. inornata]